MSTNPLISVIVPTHNRPALLEEAIASIASQALSDWEAIIVDDHSTPAVDEQQIQEKYGSKFRVLHHEHLLGGAAAKNTGLKAAEGDYVAFLDDDDVYAPDYLKNAVATLQHNPQIKTLFMSVEWFGDNSKWAQHYYADAMDKILADAAGTPVDETLLQFEDDLLFKALLKRVPMAFQRPVSTKAHFLEVGLYQDDCLLWDCEWALRAVLKGTCGLRNQDLYRQRSAGQGYSSQPRRRLDHLLSNLEIKRQLLNQNTRPDLTNAIKLNYIQAAQDLSWEYISQNQGYLAFKAMLNSFRYGINFLQIKFLAHTLYTCAKTFFSR
jgi:glycosyltransferase involved in cell wall biosynthesis